MVENKQLIIFVFKCIAKARNMLIFSLLCRMYIEQSLGHPRTYPYAGVLFRAYSGRMKFIYNGDKYIPMQEIQYYGKVLSRNVV